MSFALDPRLDADSVPLADWPLCAVRLHRDARWPWLILVPRRPGLTEIFDLSAADRARLVEEIATAGQALGALGIDKVNVGALGNLIAQLHIHVLGRRIGDDGWPGPVWGRPGGTTYAPEALAAVQAALAPGLQVPPAVRTDGMLRA